ncbi:MAG: hypothetical protein OIF57_16175 [Marinobacterium sp.]|nr:hypothetical protein [Marinobacterium sp.]
MFSSLTMLLVVVSYMAVLFGLAQWVERRLDKGHFNTNKPWLYALSLAVFHTSWTFYGSVGFASHSGLLYLGIYVGALLGIVLGWFSLQRMILIKENLHTTSVADFIANRYNRSPALAAAVTLIALIGLVPYIALQLTAIVNSIQILTQQQYSTTTWGVHGLMTTVLIILFVIIIGMRRLDPTERHQGMISALVAECLIKLVAALGVGIFVSWWLFDGPIDILKQLEEAGQQHLLSASATEDSGLRWLTLIILGFVGVQLLPRQFHVAVVENCHLHHQKTALWLFPLYMLLINLFVIPIAGAGLLMGLSGNEADYFVLLLPQQAGSDLITLLAFIGGFSAATGMVLITTLTLATMLTNHLLLPLLEWSDLLNPLRQRLLQLRWASATLIVISGYLFALEFSDTYILVSIGLLSFTAILQLAPAALLGLFWRSGNRAGAMAGLLLGSLVWFWTLALPAFIQQYAPGNSLLELGPWGIDLLRPQALFGLDGLPPFVHTTLWSLLFNLLGYILGSLLWHTGKQERTQTTEFFNICTQQKSTRRARPLGLNTYIALTPKLQEAQTLLARYLNEQACEEALETLLDDLQIRHQSHITIIELIEFHRLLEHKLAGAIGSASAHQALENSIRYSKRESSDLKALYSHIVCDMHNHERTPPGDDGNLNMLEELQNQLSRLQTTARDQQAQIERLEIRLESSYDESFNYRMETQRLRQQNTELRQRLALLSQENLSQDALSQELRPENARRPPSTVPTEQPPAKGQNSRK